MEHDLDTLSLKELRELRGRIDKAIATFDDRRKRDVVSKLEEVAREHGFALSDLSDTLTSRKRGASAARYANPANPAQTWTGRGRRPGWVSEALEAGKSLDDLAI